MQGRGERGPGERIGAHRRKGGEEKGAAEGRGGDLLMSFSGCRPAKDSIAADLQERGRIVSMAQWLRKGDVFLPRTPYEAAWLEGAVPVLSPSPILYAAE